MLILFFLIANASHPAVYLCFIQGGVTVAQVILRDRLREDEAKAKSNKVSDIKTPKKENEPKTDYKKQQQSTPKSKTSIKY